jgi:hypothetical protein
VQVDPDYNLTRQKKVYLQLAHLNRSLELHACLLLVLALHRSLELVLLELFFQEVEDVGYHRKCIPKLDVYNDLSFKYSTLSISQSDSRVSGSAENAPYEKFNSTQLDFKKTSKLTKGQFASYNKS